MENFRSLDELGKHTCGCDDIKIILAVTVGKTLAIL